MRKQTLILLFVAASLAFLAPSNGQNTAYRNAIHAKVNLTDYGYLYNKTQRVSQGFEFGYFRNLAPVLNIGLPFKMAVAKLPGKSDNTVTTSLDAVLQIGKHSGTGKFAPYVFGGAGVFSEAFDSVHAQIPLGAGINIRISQYAALNFQGEYRRAMNTNRNSIQLGAGFVYLLHKSTAIVPPPMPDADHDSIPDMADHCPTLPGPASALGCPDKDSDGLGDMEDECPDQKGTLETAGCPDKDGDAVADKNDECPDLSGPVRGCPDKDNDGTADKDDECPTEAGRWNGCPDADFDGIPDKDDACPSEAGNAANKGCPAPKDRDGDGIYDTNDLCPDTPGPLMGCPDKDGDRVADKDDACPDKAGKINGCPDTDEDGVADKDDACPDKAGKISGCPDADGDGVSDKDDACPNEAGAAASKGCPPAKDADGDGVPDKNDPCPDKAGNLGGCPDTDGDGVADNLDKCPSVAGVAADNGCPEIKQEVKERLAFATKAVQFESGKAILKMQSYAVLDDLFNILKQYPDYKLAISGHTDDQGNDEANLALSAARAKACYDYLLFRGVKENRLRFAGFGEMRPIATNATPAGRELNRRVEFELVVD